MWVDHSGLFEFVDEFGGDCKADLVEYVFELVFESRAFFVEFFYFLFEFGVLLEHSAVFLEEDCVLPVLLA